MSVPLISIIVPIYHVQNYLYDCLKSLQQQDFSLEFEVIMVDSPRNDKSVEIALEFERKDCRFHYILQQENRGVSSSRNSGLMEAKGKYITFIDGDDYVKTDYLATLYHEMIHSDAEIVIGGYSIDKSGKRIKGYSRIQKVYTGNEALEKLYRGSFKIRTFCWGRLYQKSLLEKNNIYFSEELHSYEDFYFTSQCFSKAKKIVFLKKPLYFYRQRENSIMHQSDRRTINHLKAIQKSKTYLFNTNKSLHDKIFNRSPSFSLKLQIYFDALLDKNSTKKNAIRKLKNIYKGEISDDGQKTNNYSDSNPLY